MDFSWTREQTQLRDAIVSFCRKELDKDMIAADREAVFDREGWNKCAELGIQGLLVPEEFGGLGTDALTAAYALESLGYACRDNGLLFSLNAHIWTSIMPILTVGSDEQKRKYLPGLCDGSLIGANATSEPDAGSDVYSMRTTAEKKGDKYYVSGSKIFVSNGPVADLIILFATVDRDAGRRGISAFIVEKDAPGLSVSRKMDKMGLRTSPMAELFFDNCEVPEANLLGKEGDGTQLFTEAMTGERGFILATAVGAMQRQLETCIEYARERKQFGQAIGKFQLVMDKIVAMKMRLETSRYMLYKVGWQRAQGKMSILEAAMAKLHISESWVQSSLDAIQIHGGYGYMTETELERDLRDATGSRIYSGTSEIQKLLIGPLIGL